MKPQITLLLFCLFTVICYSQEFRQNKDKNDKKQYSLIRSTVGVGGSSNTITTTTGRYVVSQSIGQSSVIGTDSKNGYTIRQGFQQPFISAKMISPSTENSLNAVLYPNPFQQSINISFSNSITNPITTILSDLMGRIIRLQKFSASQLISLPLEDISNGVYFLNVSSGNKKFTAKLIKE